MHDALHTLFFLETCLPGQDEFPSHDELALAYQMVPFLFSCDCRLVFTIGLNFRLFDGVQV